MASHGGLRAFVFAAACTGSARLSAMIGLPLVHIAVTTNRDASIRCLNEASHGSGVRAPGAPIPVRFEFGWADWAAFPLEAGEIGYPIPYGVTCVDGCIAVTLPDPTILAEFRAELAGALRHLRLQDAVIHPAYLKASNAGDPDTCGHPRYTTTAPDETILVTDLFVFDPAEDLDRLIWIAASAASAACEGILTP